MVKKVFMNHSLLNNELRVTDGDLTYADDIGSEEKYGLNLSASLLCEDGEIPIIGSIVMDPETGEPQMDADTQFVRYPNGLTGNERDVVLRDQEAIILMERIYKEYTKKDDAWEPRDESQIE